jgi:hypothetical protein
MNDELKKIVDAYKHIKNLSELSNSFNEKILTLQTKNKYIKLIPLFYNFSNLLQQ